MVFGLWWWYFDGAHAAKERHLRSTADFRLFRIWSYAHFPMYLSVATVGIGVERVIGLDAGALLKPGEAWLLAAAAAAMMAALAGIAATSRRARSSRSYRSFLAPHFLVAAGVLMLPASRPPLPPHFLVIALAIVSILQAFLSDSRQRTPSSPAKQRESLAAP
jgi:low temperature requirement protein LtrA